MPCQWECPATLKSPLRKARPSCVLGKPFSVPAQRRIAIIGPQWDRTAAFEGNSRSPQAAAQRLRKGFGLCRFQGGEGDPQASDGLLHRERLAVANQPAPAG